MTRVKICGITRGPDAELAVELGAWALGMILWPGSPRACDPATAAGIARALRRRVEAVGVFVNQPLDEVALAAEQIGLTMLQLHGDEGPAYCAEAERRTGCRVIKAARVQGPGDLRALEAFHTEFHLLDSAARGLRGGSGEAWDWSVAGAHRSDRPVILSGGLQAANVAAGIAALAPYAVDVASGVEAEPGRKDPGAMREFFAAVAATREPVVAS